MARPRRGKRRRRQRDWLPEYMVTGIEPDLDDPDINPFEVIDVCQPDSPELRAAWEASGIMRHWDIPSRRPYCWWLFDAPRLPMGTFPGRYIDGKFPEPRLHLGGPGCPRHEALNYYPVQHFGIWDWFGDPANPPTFETQFDYLKRHGLLLPGEDEPLPEHFTEPAQIMDAAKWEALRKL
jgi:hypothetical protein